MRHIRALAAVAAVLFLSLACRTTQAPGEQASDARIEAEVKADLADDVKLSTLTNIEVNSTKGEVTLSGLVSTEDQRKRAAEVAMNVEGVKKVNNNLQVAEEGS